MQISQGLNEARLAAVIDYLALGTTNAKVTFYDGTQPAFGGTATTALAEILLVEPVGTVSGNALTLTPTDEYMVTQTGVVTWARVVNGNGDLAFDCAVTNMAGAGPIKVSDTQLYAGGYTRISSGTWT
jgi:hypothetical protein